MQTQEKELKIYQILTGFLKCPIVDRFGQKHSLSIYSPTIDLLLEAQELYIETYNDAIYEGMFDEGEYLKYIYNLGVWSIEDEEEFSKLPKLIDDIKLEMYDNLNRSNTRKALKKRLDDAKQTLDLLFTKKFRLNYLTADGVANMARSYFLLGNSLKQGKESFVVGFDEPNFILDEIFTFKNKHKISESQIREIVRTEPWRSYWACGDPFGKPAIELTEEQRNLCLVSKMYDNIMESPECPSSLVLDDDDLLDGWLIKQRRRREREQNKQEGEQLLSQKVANSDMVFIPVETDEDLRRIDSMNSATAKMIKEQRIKKIQSQGLVHEQDFPDQRLKMMSKKG